MLSFERTTTARSLAEPPILENAVHDCLFELEKLTGLLHSISDAAHLQHNTATAKRVSEHCDRMGAALTGYRIWISREVAAWGL